MATLAWNRYAAVAVMRKHAMNCPTVAKEDIFCFDRSQNIQDIGISMMVRPQFELLPKMNRMLRYSMESGLFAKWERESGGAIYGTGSNVFEYNRITWKHFVGALIHLCAGLMAGLIVFCLEKIIYRFARVFHHSKFWRVTERLIDGHRYELL